MKFRALITIFALLCCLTSGAQKSASLRPKWVGNTQHNNAPEYYFIEVHSDAHSSLPAARSSVKQEIASNVERTDKVSVNEVIEDNSVETYVGNETSVKGNQTYNLKLNIEGLARPIKSRRIDEYWETTTRGGQPALDYHAIYAVERTGANADFSNISTTTSYGVSGLWRSAIVPGWGQFYKGSYLKGGLILGGTVAVIGGIIYTDSMRSDYMSKIKKTHNADNKRAYKTKADNFTTGRNVCIGALGALYIYNLIDAIVAPGARRIISSPVKSNNFSLQWAPGVLEDGAAGLAVNITF